MQFSPFKKPFEEEITQWNDQLKLMRYFFFWARGITGKEESLPQNSEFY